VAQCGLDDVGALIDQDGNLLRLIREAD